MDLLDSALGLQLLANIVVYKKLYVNIDTARENACLGRICRMDKPN